MKFFNENPMYGRRWRQVMFKRDGIKASRLYRMAKERGNKVHIEPLLQNCKVFKGFFSPHYNS